MRPEVLGAAQKSDRPKGAGERRNTGRLKGLALKCIALECMALECMAL